MEPFKNWLGISAGRRIAAAIARAYPAFDARTFLSGLEAALEPLELKERMVHLEERLTRGLPEDPRRGFSILAHALKQDEKDAVGLSGFEVWPLTHWVTLKGLAHFDLSMKALRAMTQVFTAEFAIRPFLIHHETQTLKQLHAWTADPSEHVRRLVSEGSRPLLPWGIRLPAFVEAPQKTWPLLDKLKQDPALYVRKSVANHINDHTKHHGDWVIEKLSEWQKAHADSKAVNWIIRHGTRTLIKKGHPGCLRLHGISATAVELVKGSVLTPRVHLGEWLKLKAVIRNTGKRPAEAWIDLDLQLAGSRAQARSKIFKGKRVVLNAGETQTVELALPIRPVTTRRYYPGRQSCALVVNGRRSESYPFQLLS